MKLSIKGTRLANGRINSLVRVLESSDLKNIWNYMGLRVELDPTVDYPNQNVLVRWLDIDEGFNDKIIVYDLEEFSYMFSPLTNA